MEDNIIRVSFKENEQQLLTDILNECKIIGKSAWMKLAASEKLQRDKNMKNPNVCSNTIKATNNSLVQSFEQKNISQLPIIDTLDQLFNS